MKLLVVLGSRNPEGQTARAAGALLQGALAWVWGRSERTIPTPWIQDGQADRGEHRRDGLWPADRRANERD